MQFTSMWNITGTRIHLNTRGSEPWARVVDRASAASTTTPEVTSPLV